MIETDSNDDGSGSINILFQPFTKDMQAPGANLREPYDVYVGLSIYSYLKKYEAWTEMPINYDGTHTYTCSHMKFEDRHNIFID